MKYVWPVVLGMVIALAVLCYLQQTRLIRLERWAEHDIGVWTEEQRKKSQEFWNRLETDLNPWQPNKEPK